jgi:hypothetical protein
MQALDLPRMSRAEKLRTLEALWDDLAKGSPPIESPEWHADELARTEQRIANGEETLLDWSDVQRDLRKRFG